MLSENPNLLTHITMADRADTHDLYQKKVQRPESDKGILFIYFKEYIGGILYHLREDCYWPTTAYLKLGGTRMEIIGQRFGLDG